MKAVIVGGQPGVATYASMVDRLRRAGLTIVQEIPAPRVSNRPGLHADAGLVIILTSWCPRAATRHYAGEARRLGLRHFRSTHEWSRILPNLAPLNLTPHPPDPFKLPEKPMPPAKSPAKKRPDPGEALRLAVLDLVVLMRDQRIETLTVTRDGEVSMERVVVQTETLSLGV